MTIPAEALSYIENLKTVYRQNANPDFAFWMAKYMKDKFVFYGIKKPDRVIIRKEFHNLFGWPPVENVNEVAALLWQEQERELHYFAMELLYKFRKNSTPPIINLYEEIITSKSWWDTVDYIAVKLVGHYFRTFPEQIGPVTQKWMNSGNMWLQRSCILFQLTYKKETDTDLLFSFIRPCTGSKEFFIQKAVGWALREYSKTNPRAVLSFVEQTPLKPLSKREALRIMMK